MKVLIYGETERYGTGAWCYKQALVRFGCEVVEYDNATGLTSYFNNITWRIHRRLGGRIPNWLRTKHVEPFVKLCVKFNPDVVIVLKGLYLSRFDIEQVRASGAWVVNINHDDFFSKNRNNWSILQHNCLSSYNYIFTTRSVNVAEVAPLNSKVEFFPFAYDPSIHRVMCSEGELGSGVDVLFIGTHECSRASFMEAIVKALPVDLEIYGEGWDRLASNSCLRSRVKGRGLWGDDMARALGMAKLSLGFLRKENRDEYTQRSFEIPACGGLFLAERTPSHLRFFVEGVEAEFFAVDEPTELISKVKMLLSDSARRKAIRVAGNAAILRQKHTYDDRISCINQRYLQWKSAMCHSGTN
jgi:spore maturation protein CgeB